MKKYMLQALKEAKKAMEHEDIPIGCVIEKDGIILGAAGNCVELKKDPTAHAEMEAIKQAIGAVGIHRLTGCNMYVTLEPCSMCAGAIVLSRIENLYIGTMDPKSGACGSVINIVENEKLNHKVNVIKGVMEEECSTIIKDFFKELRKRNGGSNK